MKEKTRQDMEGLGLKTAYNFKQICIPASGGSDDKRRLLIELVAPAIRELESKSLINGFYYTIQSDIDLRLSCENWEQYEEEIAEVLGTHSIQTDLEHGGNLWPDDFGGEEGAALTENNLELNSRLVLSMLEVVRATDDEATLEALDRQCPHQWMHNLCNQYGLNNLQESVFDFNNAMVWLETTMQNHSETPEIVSEVRKILDYIKGRTALFEDTFFSDAGEDM